MLCRPPPQPGTYLLLVRVRHWHAVRVDSAGRRVAVLPPGLYAYVGSAWGPGGLAARISRHLGLRRKRPHWHIDRILASEYAEPVGVVYAVGCRGERELAARLARVFRPVAGVGSTDDPSVPSHLFALDDGLLERAIGEMRTVCGVEPVCCGEGLGCPRSTARCEYREE